MKAQSNGSIRLSELLLPKLMSFFYALHAF